MLGKDADDFYAQLMTGVDYGGVSLTGLGFNIGGGWDTLPFFTDSWDGFDADFDDYIKVVGSDSDAHYEHQLPYTCLLYTSPSPRDVEESRMPSSA